ncbi:MAG: S-layer homology domain-containing protein [Clostridia bacterium]|nr:S-layer homology domain-containing protein [Clostridia bacterium]
MKRFLSTVLALTMVLTAICTNIGFVFADEADEDPCSGYTDINRDAWYHPAADFVIQQDIMGSTHTTRLTFEPNTKTSRAMVAGILYRLNGSPAVPYQSRFSDVKDGMWYTSAVLWASDKGIILGYGNGKFGPNDIVSREQLAQIIMSYSNKTGKKTDLFADLDSYSDAEKVSNWANLSVRWAVGAGVISGEDGAQGLRLDPKGQATRAEVAMILMNYLPNRDSMPPLADRAVCSHNWILSSTTATCTKAGSVTSYCTECASSKTETVGPLGHNMVNQGTSGEYTEDDIGYYGTVTSKCSRCGYSTSEKQLIRKWSDFNVSYMQQAAVNYACSQYGCKYDPSMNLSNSSYYSGYTAFGYDENKIISKACGQVDFTFNKRMEAMGRTLEDLFATPYRVNVYIEQDGSGWEIYVLYG